MKKNWNPAPADLIISASVALLFPLIAGRLYAAAGALLPMALYYGTAWGLSIWRRGGTGYSLKYLPAPPIYFHIHLAVIGATLALAWFARISSKETTVAGVLLTAAVWAVINASSEQLLWLYIFDSWDLYARERRGKAASVLLRAVGLVLFTLFVATIHTLFWTRFLHTVDPALLPGRLFVVGTSLSGYLHILVWRKSGRMIYTFIPHFLLNLIPLFLTGYSILPYLFPPA